jgi:hypothetical protein
MPLITCPDCGHHPVSDRAEACPKCGCPIAKAQSGTVQQMSANAPASQRAAITTGPLQIRLAGKWKVYAADRPYRQVAEYETPRQVNLVPGEIYAFWPKIKQKSDILLLEELANIVPLRRLMLFEDSANLSDECLAAVRGFTYLEELDFVCKPSFQGISYLKHMTSLKRLALQLVESAPVTDEAIMQLSCLTNLEKLLLGDAPVTLDCMNRLRQLLPHCKVERYG